jgi:hypothetical protein
MKKLFASVFLACSSLAINTSFAADFQFKAVADAGVKKSYPTKNYGSNSIIRVDGSPIEEAFIKFDVSGISGTVSGAKVRIYLTNGSSNGPGIYASGTDWSESSITYSNRPSRISSKLEGKGALPAKSYVDYNVSEVVKGNGTYSFVIGAGSSDQIEFHARTNTNGPVLIITSDSTPVNQPPKVTANSDISINLPTNSVNLSALATDADGKIASYAWSKLSGGAATISSPSASSTSVTGLSQGTYVFRVSVKDDKGAEASDDVQITVNGSSTVNKAPVVNAGADQTLTLPSNSLTLSAQASDSDGSIVKYSWEKTAGGAATVASPSAASTKISGLIEGSYTFKVSVTDNSGAVASDDVVVVVKAASQSGPLVWSEVPCGPENNFVQYMGVRWANNSNCAPYSIGMSPSKSVLRFEVRDGDKRWNGADDGSAVERDELRLEDFRPKPGTEIWMAYSLFIEEGQNTDSRWTILGQMHAGSGSPPLNFDLSSTNTIRIMTYSDRDSGMQKRAEFPVKRGQWYSIVFRAKFIGQGYDGPGILEVWVNGEKMYGNTNLYMGMPFSDHNYWKIGVYRRESKIPLAVRFANVEWATGANALSNRITNPQPVNH